jgi:sugar phosphate isomerase/epimerase
MNNPLFSVFTSLLALAIPARALPPLPDDCKTGGFAAGCQAWTWNKFTVFEGIEKTAACGAKVIELYPGQKLDGAGTAKFDHNAPPEAIERVKACLKQHGVRAVNYGVVNIPKDEAEARKVFEFAKTMGIRALTTEAVNALDLIEKLAVEYDIGVGIHNHPRRQDKPDYKVWDPKEVLAMVKDRDARVGAAVDTGHWARSGLDPVESLRLLKGRLISVHLKDVNESGKREARDVPFGTGVNNVKGTLDELKAQGFDGNISIEYEHDCDQKEVEVKQCMDFLRAYGGSK